MSDVTDERERKLSQEMIDYLMEYETATTFRPRKLPCHRMLTIFFQCIDDNDYASLTEEFTKYSARDMELNSYTK